LQQQLLLSSDPTSQSRGTSCSRPSLAAWAHPACPSRAVFPAAAQLGASGAFGRGAPTRPRALEKEPAAWAAGRACVAVPYLSEDTAMRSVGEQDQALSLPLTLQSSRKICGEFGFF